MYCYDDSTLTFNMFHKVRPFIKLKMQNPQKFTQEYCIRDKLIKESKVISYRLLYIRLIDNHLKGMTMLTSKIENLLAFSVP